MHTWLIPISDHPWPVLASVVMFVAGALIGAGVLNVWLSVASAILGAIAGDGLAYELGRRYHADVGPWITASGHGDSWASGERFVERHGVWSQVRARLCAPVRPIVTLLVGSARMGRLKFWSINLVSALVWAPLSLGPGMIVGAAARVAGSISPRAAFAMMLLPILLYFVVRLAITRGIPLLKHAALHGMLVLMRRFPRFADSLQRCIKVDAPEFPAICAFALLFLASVWLFGGVLQDVVANDPLMQVDTALYSFLRSLHTTPVNALVAGFAAVNGRTPGFVMAAAVSGWFILRRSWKTAAWWAIALGVAAVLSPSGWVETAGVLPANWQAGTPHTPLPDGQAAFNILLYGLLGWIATRRQSAPWRNAVATTLALWIVAGGLADLYLGNAWLSGLLGGWAPGMAWLAILGGAYGLWHVHDEVHPKGLAIVAVGSLTVVALWAVLAAWQTARLSSVSAIQPVPSLTPGSLINTILQQVPALRTDVGSENKAESLH
ncbi:cytochrome O ubiquinol oxidase [Paraburkholderia sp. EG287A]|uniref:VTT domain-containing protein n=1 Tax=unclassified Paraburkholderia TaxID=2615204 RepID=UPI0034D25437